MDKSVFMCNIMSLYPCVADTEGDFHIADRAVDSVVCATPCNDNIRLWDRVSVMDRL